MQGNHRVKEPGIPWLPPVCRSYRAVGKPGRLDGDTTKAFWQTGIWMEDFRDIEGDSQPRPWKKTRVKVLWDEEALYVAAELKDDTIWSTVTQRDDIIYADNDFEVFLDPMGTSHRYYELEMNAGNVVWDLLMEKTSRDRVRRISAWDIAGLETAVKVDGTLNDPSADNRGWSVEIKIPWTPLRECALDSCRPSHLAPETGEIWRLNFSRVEYEVDVVDGKYVKRGGADGNPLPEHNWVWAPTGVIDIHMPEMWGYLVFTESGEEYPLPDATPERILRKLYYREHAYCCEHGCFTEDVRALTGDELTAYDPKIYVTPSLFEGIVAYKGETYHIRQDGYFWKGDDF